VVGDEERLPVGDALEAAHFAAEVALHERGEDLERALDCLWFDLGDRPVAAFGAERLGATLL
jgi:hypothetical protein